MHFAGAHEVKREPIKRAVVPVAVGRAGGGAGVESTLERALPAHAETHAPRPARRAPTPTPTLNTLDGHIATELPLGPLGGVGGGGQQTSTSNRRLEGGIVDPYFM